jgi:hypothetical protein
MPDILLIWLKFAWTRRPPAKAWFLPAALSDGACGASAGCVCCDALTPVSITGARVGPSGERVKYLLHVIILFELVDHGQNFRRLFFRQLSRHRTDVLVLG